MISRIFTTFLFILFGQACLAEQGPVVGVASNFLLTARELAQDYETQTGVHVTLTHGSTGKLYAQIVNGAPIDVFLSADSERPALLLADGLAVETQHYALGRLVYVVQLRSNTSIYALQSTEETIAIADPAIAPYGKAAQEVLQNLRGEQDWNQNVVLGENVGQAFAYWSTGNAPKALVAASQAPQIKVLAVITPVPENLYSPIMQDAALIHDTPNARAFFDYLTGTNARKIIANANYGLPE